MSSTLSLTLLLMLTGCAYLINAAPLGVELRCKCVKTISDFIHPKQIANLIITQEGPHCSNTEVIITLKNGGKEFCVNPKPSGCRELLQHFCTVLKGNNEKDLCCTKMCAAELHTLAYCCRKSTESNDGTTELRNRILPSCCTLWYNTSAT